MSKYRPLTEKNKYYLQREDYLTAIHYSLRYPLWVAELETAADTRGAIRYDQDHVQITNEYDSTSETAIRLAQLIDKVNLVDEMIRTAAEGTNLDHWIRLGVCYGFTFDQLKTKGIPCERDMYYRIRRRYLYELSQRI